MTITQLDELARAEQIAQRDGLHALKGTNGRWAVLNRRATVANGYPTYHVLSVVGERIVCECPAASNGRICAHRAAVRMALVVEREVAQAVQAERQAEHTTTEAARRESSRVARPAFSMWA